MTDTDPTTAPDDHGPVLLAGDDNVIVRVREDLAGLGIPTVSICAHADSAVAEVDGIPGASLVVGDATDEVTWERAGLSKARSVGVLGPDDLHNLNAALHVADHCRGPLPIVVRLFSTDLAPGVARMLGSRATVVSEIELAAPAFVQAALSGNTGQRVTIAGRVLEVAEVDPADPTLVVALANADTPTDVLPPSEELDPRVLGLVDKAQIVAGARGALPSSVARQRLDTTSAAASAPVRRHRTSRVKRARAAIREIPRRAWALLATIIAVATISTTVFALSKHLDAIDSLYFTVTTMATVGYGDVNLATAPDWLKLYDIGLMVVSAVLLASVLALVTDLLVRQRIDRALGRYPRPTENHVIVCGLGKAGSRILAALHELDVPCVGVEQNGEAVGIAVARQLEIPVVFADARSPGTLASLHVDKARAAARGDERRPREHPVRHGRARALGARPRRAARLRPAPGRAPRPRRRPRPHALDLRARGAGVQRRAARPHARRVAAALERPAAPAGDRAVRRVAARRAGHARRQPRPRAARPRDRRQLAAAR